MRPLQESQMFPHERSLVERLKDEPFALLGVNSDRDKVYYADELEANGVSWRSFWNGPKGTFGPIAVKWGVRSWPTIYVVDHNGVIRFKNVRGEEMDSAVDQLLEEMRQDEKAQSSKDDDDSVACVSSVVVTT